MSYFKIVVGLYISICLFACQENSVNPTNNPIEGASLYFPPLNSNLWEDVDPNTFNWCTSQLNALESFLDQKNTKAFIVLKNGKIAIEWYFDTFTKDSVWYWASAGKTITAFLIGKAQQEGLLNIRDKTSDYLGAGWTSAPSNKENLITINHQLTMTSGLDDGVSNSDCTNKICLQYQSDAGSRWAYHNAPYTLLSKVIESASGKTRNQYTNEKLENKIGMQGFWRLRDFNEVYFSNARSMARFGLLMLNQGVWKEEVLIDKTYFDEMINTSQNVNQSYGYLWWLNGKGQHMLPQSQFSFSGDLIPGAPDDIYAALGKNDQKIYVVPSQQLVVIRMGESAGNPRLAASSFDTNLWEMMGDLKCEE